MANFFEGLKIVELSSVLAGPAVGMFFAELGAEIIKVENLNTDGDVTRQWRLAGENADGPSAYFSSVNYKKKYLQLDLNQAAEKDKLLDLCLAADILISNYSTRTTEKFKLGYEDLKAKNPKLIYLQLDGFAESDRPAYDVVLQAETGWISMTGTSSDLAKMPVAMIDVIAGHQLKEAALLALLKRGRTGKGSFVSCDLERASLSALANQASNYLMQKAVAKPMGTLHPNIAPYGDVFVTKEGVKMVLAIGSEKQFSAFWKIIFADEPIDRLFENNTQRLKNRAALTQKLQEGIGKQDFNDLAGKMDLARIPYGEIKSMDKVLTSRAAQGMVLKEEIDGKDTSRLSGIAFSTDFLTA